MPRQADPKVRAGLLSAGRDLFLANGYAATGIEEICRTAGVTRGALFHLFEGKEDLALEVLAEWTRAGAESYKDGPFFRATNAVDRVLGYVDFTTGLARQAPVGCLIGAIALETSATHPQLRARTSAAFGDWRSGLASMLEDAKRESPTATNFDVDSVAAHFIVVFEGAQLMAKNRQSTEAVAEHLSHFRTFLEYLLGVVDDRSGTAPHGDIT